MSEIGDITSEQDDNTNECGELPSNPSVAKQTNDSWDEAMRKKEQ